MKAEHLQFFGKFKSLSLKTQIQAERLAFNTYTNFPKMAYTGGIIFLQHWQFMEYRPEYAMGIGTRFEAFGYKPR
jgi:hypothetical protein